jgi:hypothetical protein
MIRRILLTMSTFALVVASAASTYTVTVFEKSMLSGKELKAGDYKVELKGDNTAILKQGKNVLEVPVKVQNSDKKINSTSIKYVNGAIQEIRLGGTNTTLVFDN